MISVRDVLNRFVGNLPYKKRMWVLSMVPWAALATLVLLLIGLVSILTFLLGVNA